jgi:hypothetical protein
MPAQGLSDARGSTCNANGEVFFVDPPNNKAKKEIPQNAVTSVVSQKRLVLFSFS